MKLKKNSKALVIVAHPDDETIWMGGLIMRNPQVEWMIMSTCRASDTDRAPKFARVCAVYKAHALIEDMDDEGKWAFQKNVRETKKVLLKHFAGKQFDYLFTHGMNGEYGHPVHKVVHEAVYDLIRREKIKANEVYFFNYKKKYRRPFSEMIIRNNSDVLVPLTKSELMKKKEIVSKMHGYPMDGIDVSLCMNPEAFRKMKK